MAKINILPSKVYNRIAAGEVVDRPCSVVKELVENAIDAGATEIEIHIENGGKQLIRVIDNGAGIEREDLQSAYLPHATSKIAKAEDLENIMTLGFRGEAIASISAVSCMTITSKTATGKCYSLSCDGGELGSVTEASGENGTDVRVEMLFYHTPVRLGFLKSDKAEETEITNFVSRFILNRSDIAFTYYANGKKVLQSFGGGDEEAMVSVYGAATLSECFAIDAIKHGIHIRGYIGNQNYSKANKSYQSIFLNGRYIVNTTISAALSNAYASYMMKRQYPFYVLHVDMPTEIVDVNVHPNKADVRFADNQIVYGCIYSVVSGILDGQPKALEYIVKTPTKDFLQGEPMPAPVPKKVEKESLLPKIEEKPAGTAGVVLSYEEAKKEIEESAPVFTANKKGMELPFDVVKKPHPRENLDPSLRQEPPYPKGFVPMGHIPPYDSREAKRAQERILEAEKEAGYDKLSGAERLHKRFPDLYYKKENTLDVYDGKKGEVQEVKPAPVEEEDIFEANKRFLAELDAKNKQDRIEVVGVTYVGKIFNTYLIYEKQDGESVYLIDQHAAHERLIFDKLKAQMEERKVVRQPLLIPYPFELNAFESQFMRDHIEVLYELGFDVQETEPQRFEVLEIPIDLAYIDVGSFINDVLSEINGYRAIKLENLLKDKLASAACKAAVKGGVDLTRVEIDELFRLMDGDMGLKCPHGRPVVVKLTKKQIEKMFKRIV